MIRTSCLMVAAAVMLAIGPATADDRYEACIQTSGASNAWFAACGSSLLERQEERLTTAWHRTYGAVTGVTKTDLLAEQRAWLAFKDRSCRLYANGDWGREREVLDFYQCREKVITERIRELSDYEHTTAE